MRFEVRHDHELAADAHRRGLWVDTTLADALRTAAETSPERTVLIDGNVRVDCATLHAEATRLANTKG